MTPSLLKLIADNEQDTACVQKWWDESSLDEKNAVMEAACSMAHADNATIACVGRFAQLKIGELLERTWRADGN